MENSYADDAAVFKAMADENRLKILELLRQGEKCGNDLLEAVNVSQSTLSHHMKVMCASGIVKSRKSGTWTYYSISPEGAKAAKQLFATLTLTEDEPKSDNNVISSNQTVSEKSPEKAVVKVTKGGRPNGWLL